MEGPNLDQHEIIKFLTLKGGRCTNFELVSNFRGALNHPQYQAEARLRFKDIVNRVAIVGEHQNVKYIELKKEYLDNNLASDSPSPQPTSLSSDNGGSYSSPFTEKFQPYWRYRLATSTRELHLPVRSPNCDIYSKIQTNDPESSNIERSVSETTLSQPVNDIQPPPRTRGRSSSGVNRSVSTNSPENANPHLLYRNSSFTGTEYMSRRSSVNGYPPQPFSVDFNNIQQNSGFYSHQHYPNQQSTPTDTRRNSEVFIPERPPRSQWPPSSRRELNKINPENPTLSHSRSFSGSHSSLPSYLPLLEDRHHPSRNTERWKEQRQFMTRAERSPKRTGICSDDMLRELEEEDTPKPYIEDFKEFYPETITENGNFYTEGKEENYSSLPDYSYNQSQPNDLNFSTPNNCNNSENNPLGYPSRNEYEQESVDTNHVKRNLFPHSNNNQSENLRTDLSKRALSDDSISSFNSVNSCSSKNGRDLHNSSSSSDYGKVIQNDAERQPVSELEIIEGAPPVPPERRRKGSKTSVDITNEDDPKPNKELPDSTGKVKDRVQHFDDLEKKINHHTTKHVLSSLPDKENRGSKTSLMEDDVSISVLDPKLKREWFVKAAQGDYYALVGLLKKEPKLAAIKDIASTALHWGAKHGDDNIIKLIAGTYKVNPNIRSGGYTAIHLATLYKHSTIVDLLVNTYGADPSIRDYSGKRANQYPENYIRTVAGLKTMERRPLKVRPLEKESSVSAFMRIGSLNLRKSRKSAVFASVRGRTWGSATELRLNNYKSTRKKNSKNIQQDKKCDNESKNESDSDSAYGFNSKSGM